VVAMVKPQFEVGEQTKHKGVIKNESLRRAVFKEFEAWVKDIYKIRDKADSKVSGEKGNTERFYVLTLLK
jgi:predicted rRNA methylase YqxC with S4 and FtsJ domains